MGGTWRLLAAYACSGAAGLIYEVSWTRQLTLSMGHTTAAVSTVVAAFMGGLAAGAALGGRVAPRLTPRAALYGYAALELTVAVLALLTGRELALLAPLLERAYADGHAPIAFGLVRLIASLALLSVPAAALGATFPLALRGLARVSAHPGGQGGAMYAANTFGAALGALGAGFVLLPNLGLFRTIIVGASASSLAAALAMLIGRTTIIETPGSPSAQGRPEPVVPRRGSGPRGSRPSTVLGATLSMSKGRGVDGRQPVARTKGRARSVEPAIVAPRIAAAVLGLTGFATFAYEISWTRVFSMIAGPSTYAFSTVVTAVIAGTALGSVGGTWLSSRLRRPEMGLLFALGVGALALAWTTTLAGGEVPRMLMRSLTQSGEPFASLMASHALTIGVVLLPTAAALGVAFPLALELAGADDTGIARRVGYVYAVNTIGSVLGALTAGFVTIPQFGLERTLWIAMFALCAATLVVALGLRMSRLVRIGGLALTAIAVAVIAMRAGWDRELLASGAYKYARMVPPSVDAEAMLKAGSLLYYREGAAATVSVKRLTGEVSLSVDGKVDASTSGDMLTQKLLAHVPLLLHPRPRDVAIIGLGSGVTLAAALTHPIESAEIVEISPEVVEASQYFESVNNRALGDPRTRLIVGDGRSHLLLGSRKYDVIISEPSNPWMAGVSALFTREFFTAMRDRLAPGGLVCQWAHTYDISDADLRSVVGTFASVFPDGTLWMVGAGDLLLIGGDAPVADRLDEITRSWSRSGAAADLAQVGALEPFSVLSLYVGGRDVLHSYTSGAAVQTDDRQALEFSGPAALYSASTDQNISAIRAAQRGAESQGGKTALAGGTAAQWRNRAAMLFKASAYADAFESYQMSLKLDATDAESLIGIVPVAVAARRQDEALQTLRSLASAHPDNVMIRVGLSKLLASSGAYEEAVAAATDACRVGPKMLAGYEQLASVFADAGNAEGLESAVEMMRQIDPQGAGTWYYTAALDFLRGRLDASRDAAEKAAAADPRRAAAYNLLGAAHASGGNHDRARQAFVTAMEINPRDSATYINLAVLELNSGNPRAASGWFAEALSLDPTSEEAQKGLVRAEMSTLR